MEKEITVCKYNRHGFDAAAVYKPAYHWQNFAARFSNDRECNLMRQTPVERLSECIMTRYPDAKITVINRNPWD